MSQYQCNMPVENEESYDKSRENNSQSFRTSLYKPLPHVSGESFMNELVVPVFSPKNWAIFNQTPEDCARLGLTGVNPFAAGEGQEDLITFYLRVATHSIKNYTYPDGRTGFASVICPKGFNNYLTQVTGRTGLFKSDNCPFCTASSNAWSQYNARWKEIEMERGISKKDLNPDGRREIAKKDDVLKYWYELAVGFTSQDKYVLSPFDHSKYLGVRPKDGEDEELGYQPYFAPKTIFGYLVEFWKEDSKSGLSPFFSLEDPEGFRIIKVKKSTEDCRGNNLRDTKYTVMQGSRFQYPDEWKNYLKDINNMADPSPYLAILTPSEMEKYANDSGDVGTSYNTPAQTQSQPPVQQQVQASAPPSAPSGNFSAPAIQRQATPPSVGVMNAPPTTAGAPLVPQVNLQGPPMAAPSVPVPPTAPSTTAPPVRTPDRTPPSGDMPPNRHSW